MIIELFTRETRKPYWYKKYKYDNVFFMQWIYDEHEHTLKELIIITVEWIVKTFGNYDELRFDIEFNEEDNDFAVCFKNQDDAMIFKLNPPSYKTIRFITSNQRKDIYKEFGYDVDEESEY